MMLPIDQFMKTSLVLAAVCSVNYPSIAMTRGDEESSKPVLTSPPPKGSKSKPRNSRDGYHLPPIPVNLDINFTDSKKVKKVRVCISSSDPKTLVLNMSLASYPRDERVTCPGKHRRCLPTGYCYPENTYVRQTDQGYKRVEWANLLGKPLLFSIQNERDFPNLPEGFGPKDKGAWSTLSIQHPFAIYVPFEETETEPYRLYVSVKVDDREWKMYPFSIVTLPRNIKVQVKQGKVRGVGAA